VPKAVAQQLHRHDIDAVHLADWLDGRYRNAPDSQILLAARADQRVFVSYDERTIPDRLAEWAEQGIRHAGVVLVNAHTIKSDDIGGLVRSLRALIEVEGDANWEDRLAHLQRV
jgi:hypothetical protein